MLLSHFNKVLVYNFDAFNEKYREQSTVQLEGFLNTSGYQICSKPVEKVFVGRNIFECGNGIFLSTSKVCDGITDCDSDEVLPLCHISNHSSLNAAFRKLFKDRKLLHMSMEMSENKVKKGRVADKMLRSFKFDCDKRLIDSSHLNDLYNDCGEFAADKPILKALLKNRIEESCQNQNQFPCFLGHSKCLSPSDLCIHRVFNNTDLVPCRNGGHLENCTDFQCNMMFKCPNQYCIPWEHVCDNVWDCPSGTDENSICSEYTCKQMYKCNGFVKKCIHIGTVCNKKHNCPLGDDEQFCELRLLSCPTECHCGMHTLICMHVGVVLQQPLHSFYFIFMTNVTWNVKKHTFTDSQNLMFYSFTSLHLPLSCDQDLFPPRIVAFRVEFCLLRTVQFGCFKHGANVKNIQLSRNSIELIKLKAFLNLSNLNTLNLSHNLLTKFSKGTLFGTRNLTILSLAGNKMTNVVPDAFGGLMLGHLEITDSHLCCMIDRTTSCSQQIDKSVCSELLPNRSLKITFVVVSIFILLSSSVSSVLFLKKNDKSKKSSIIIPLSVNCSEIFCVFYLCIIWVADVSFKNVYLLKEQKWRSSISCNVASSFLFAFCVCNPALLFLLSLSRYMVVKYPIESQFKTVSFTFKWMIVLVVMSLCMSASFSVLISVTGNQLPMSICFPFVDPTNLFMIGKVSEFFVATFQFIVLVAIYVLHCFLWKEVEDSKKAMAQARSSQKSQAPLVLQLVALTCSNTICWIPANTIFLMSLFGPNFPPEMIIWTAAVVTPLNAVISPVVWIVNSVRILWKERRSEKGNTQIK